MAGAGAVGDPGLPRRGGGAHGPFGNEALGRLQGPEVPVEFVPGVVLGVGHVVGEGAAVEGVSVRPDLVPQRRETVTGLFPVSRRGAA